MPTSRILFAGSGEFGLPTLIALRAAGHGIAAVISQPDRPAGRHQQLAPTPISRYALDEGLPLVRTEDINNQPLPDADVMVIIAFGQKLGEAVAHHARLGSVNLHASRLPRYRGAAPINWAIIRGETVTGNSVIRLAPKMDAGAVLAQSTIAIDPQETAGELHDRLACDGASLLPAVIEDLLAGRAIESPQDESLATAAPKLSRETASLDFSRAARVVAALVRGLSPWPGCRVRLRDAAGNALATARLLRAIPSPRDGPTHEIPGTILADGRIATAGGAIEILQLQPDGKRAMALDEYRRGNRWEAAMRVESIH